MGLSGEDLGWRVRVQRLQIVRQHADVFCQRRRDFHGIELPNNQDRLKVSIVVPSAASTSILAAPTDAPSAPSVTKCPPLGRSTSPDIALDPERGR